MNQSKTIKDYNFWHGDFITRLKPDEVFVFGSNPEGRHGAGAAKQALQFGAQYGQGRGLMGQTYGLVTKNLEKGFMEPCTGIVYHKDGKKSVSLEQIADNIDELYQCARDNPDLKFYITYKAEYNRNGNLKQSLNGYDGQQMLEAFTWNKEVPNNIYFHESFKDLLEHDLKKSQTLNNNKNEQHFENLENTIDNSSINNGDDQNNKTNQIIEEFEFFWQANSPFSQWHPSVFEYKNMTFISAEQFMMVAKAYTFNDTETANKMLNLNNKSIVQDFLSGHKTAKDIVNNDDNLKQWKAVQKSIKKLGRQVKNYNDNLWNQKRENVVKVATREKFNQNSYLLSELLATNDKTMVEASPYDTVWGIGLKASDARAKNPDQWQGLNLLGQILTQYKKYILNNKNKLQFK